MKRHAIALLTLSHFCTDLNQGALPALLPFFIAQHHFSYAAAATLVLTANAASSLIQPLFGQVADLASVPWLMPMGIFLAGSGIALTGIAPNYETMLFAVALSGVGLAAFHPEAARMVNHIATHRRATGMSVFSVGGNAGFAIGPLLATTCLALFGLHGTLLLMIPGVLMAAGLASQLPRLESYVVKENKSRSTSASATFGDAWEPFTYLTSAVVCRSIIFFGLNTFIPLYWIAVLHQSKAAGSTALTVMLISGAIGTLVGGRLADRYGRPAVVMGGLGFLLPLLLTFVCLNNVSAATFFLVLIGFALFAPFSVMVVMGQEYLPNRVGVASGVTLGLAGSVGGLATPLLGWIADQYGIDTALKMRRCIMAV